MPKGGQQKRNQSLSFSQRQGLKPVQKALQKDGMDPELRTGLWNAFHWNRLNVLRSKDYENIWVFFYKRPIDEFSCEDHDHQIRYRFFNAEWNDVYDLIEFIIPLGVCQRDDKFVENCNLFLERENSAYRIVNGLVSPITSGEEIQSIEMAIEKSLPFSGVRTHLEKALSHLSDRGNPDYRNSIKESISAVESLAKHISGNKNATLGDALKAIRRDEKLHPALEGAFSKLYGYASDAGGIRHALMEESTIGDAEAKFMLVACSAFTNYLIEKVEKKQVAFCDSKPKRV